MMPALDWLEGNSARLTHPSAGLFFWGSGILSSALDNAPTYLSFLSSIIGSSVSPEVVGQVQHLVQAHGTGLAAASEPAQLTYAVLQKYHSLELASGHILPEQIEIAYLLGQPGLNQFITAISVGAVFFGANTYIGNGPNFMVKSIADHQKVHVPGFLHYITFYSIPCMFPMLLLVWWLFFR
jgi:Na+/H+ antiporter NhaD/arsenite permease-like protein